MLYNTVIEANNYRNGKTMNRKVIEEFLKNGGEIIVSRDRASVNGTTISRKIFESLLDDGKIVFSHKPNNFIKAYKAV